MSGTIDVRGYVDPVYPRHDKELLADLRKKVNDDPTHCFQVVYSGLLSLHSESTHHDHYLRWRRMHNVNG